MVYELIRIKLSENRFALFSTVGWYTEKIGTQREVQQRMDEIGISGLDFKNPTYEMTNSEFTDFICGRGRHVVTIPLKEILRKGHKVD